MPVARCRGPRPGTIAEYAATMSLRWNGPFQVNGLAAVFETVPFNRSGTSPHGANYRGLGPLPDSPDLRQLTARPSCSA
jgi:hypothetical protein